MTSFWPGSPRRWAEFEGCLIDTVNPRLTGTLRSYRPGEAERTRRIELGFASSGQLLWRSYAAGTGGTDYLAEELVYTRAPTGPEQLGDMDALLGPATRVNQGVGMTSEIRAALSPSEPHSFLGSLVGAPVW